MSRMIPVLMTEGALSDAGQEPKWREGHGGPRAPAARADTDAPAHSHADDPRKGVPGPAPVYLKVADSEISEADIAREMQFHRSDTPHRSRTEAARALVVRELLRLEIERLALAHAALPEADETIEEASIRVLLERELVTPEPDPSACRRYFDANRARLRQPDRIQVRHILLAAPPADAAGRAKASAQGEALIAELTQHPERFTEFAQRHSDCPSKDHGGELGWVAHGQTTPEFERQLFMLKPGLAGLTVESRWGHHVVMVDAIERGELLGFEQAAPKIAAYLETQVKQNAIHQYLQILRQRYPVQGLDELESTA